MSSQQGKKEDRIEKLEELKKKNDELSKWVNYVEDDLDSLIFKMRLRQNKEEEDKSKNLEDRNDQDEGLDGWRRYAEEDLNNIIWKMEKLEDDLNMKIRSRSNLQEETKNLIKFMKKTLERYCTTRECMTRVEDGLSLQDIENNI